MFSESMKTAAGWADRRIWKVFPVNPDTKAPLVTDPFGKASYNEHDILTLFSPFPKAAYGIPCGPINGITVLDIDRKNGIDGLVEFHKLELNIPETAVVKTPSNGFHIYFETGDLKVPNSVSSIAPGIDVRGVGGYVLGPDSITPRGKYIWDLDHLSPIGRLAKIPAKLLQLILSDNIQSPCVPFPKSNVRNELLEPIEQGQRNNKMASRIGFILKRLDPKQAWKAVEHINTKCCKPPLDHRELDRTFRSILKREMPNG